MGRDSSQHCRKRLLCARPALALPPIELEVGGDARRRTDFVIGVDTTATSMLLQSSRSEGRLLPSELISANERGYWRAFAFALKQAPGRRAWAIEGTGSYGKRADALPASGGASTCSRSSGPSGRAGSAAAQSRTALDALRAARQAARRREARAATPPARRESLRVLLQVARRAGGAEGAPQPAAGAARHLPPSRCARSSPRSTRARLLARCRALAPKQKTDPELNATLRALRYSRTRIDALSLEQRELDGTSRWPNSRPASRPARHRPDRRRPDARRLVTPGRFGTRPRSRRLAGAPPIPASSGQTSATASTAAATANSTASSTTVVVTRRKHDPETIAYIERRRSEGKTDREAIRCLKRYIARRTLPTPRGERHDRLTFIEASFQQHGRSSFGI